jgi:hypothetical protein
MPATPMPALEPARDDASYYSSTMSRSTNMASPFLPIDLNPLSLNSEANDSFMSHKTQLSYVEFSFDDPIMSPLYQDVFKTKPDYSTPSKSPRKDITSPLVRNVNRRLSSASSTSGHQRFMCDKCNMNPDGFRGEHELSRHNRLFHARVTRKWVCTNMCEDDGVAKCEDWVAPKLPLSECQNCRNGKQYGQYYNAAAQ